MSDIRQRKLDHIKIVEGEQVEPIPSPFSNYRLPYKALPEIDLAEIDPAVDFFNWKLSFPLVISSMTGGEKYGRTINENVARAANAEGVAFGLGSMRVIRRYEESIHTFDVKEFAPDVPMFANVGLVQLNYGFDIKDFRAIIDSVKADGLFIHVNHLQEVAQPEGDTNFKDLLPKLEQILAELGDDFPVVVKEVGHGFDRESAQALRDIGVEYLDVAGLGGTSWAWVEGYRQPSELSHEESLGYILRAVGIPTDESLIQCREVEGLKLISGGGLRTGLDMAIATTLGADYSTIAKPFLSAALESTEAVQKLIQRLKREYVASMFAAGASTVAELKGLNSQRIF